MFIFSKIIQSAAEFDSSDGLITLKEFMDGIEPGTGGFYGRVAHKSM